MKTVLRLAALGILFALPLGLHAEGELGSGLHEVSGPGTQTIAVIDGPRIEGDGYAVTGSVAYAGVEGTGFLEMWSVFPDGSRYFSRTLDERGPGAKLRGSSPERPFALPFFLRAGDPRPVRLELNVVLPAGGEVVVRDLSLETGAAAGASPGAWWSAHTAGWIGAAAGSAVGGLGAAIGTLCSLGRGRRFAIAGLLAIGVSGLVLLAAGVLALALGQPYEVWYPLLLLGALDPAIAFSLLPTVRRRFEALELRRMQALDAR